MFGSRSQRRRELFSTAVGSLMFQTMVRYFLGGGGIVLHPIARGHFSVGLFPRKP